ncbi:TonB-dependent receptor [Methylophilus sp. QUAN]|uniref:TonB-dependent receptor family protein n=1 Tax=Methylophilus sp. QUAN TaxID=2781020 RepID=UPI00188FAD28|nr:TonB-dependent receptor [Methylophilus sp. QUAN]MBF4990134.1 TonB-dependent receptor [Methylophilus sp. QUAN]
MNKTKICLAILAAMPYLAQAEHEGTVHLDEVKVVAKKNKASLTQPDIETAKENLSKTAGGTTVVNMETVREGRTSNMQDTLGMATGVLAQSRFGAEETRLSIRGSGLQRTFHGRGLKLMQDGIAVNLADGGFDFPGIDPMATDYIEVYRGANALQYGSTNLGGSINFISRTGYTAPALEVRSEGGSYGYYRLGVSTGGVKDNVDYFVSASKYHSDSFRDNAQQGADRLTGNVGVKINEQVETRFFFGYVNNDSQLSSSLTKAQLKDNPRQATVIPGQGINERNINVTRLANKTTILFDQSKLELGAYYARKGLFHPIGNFGDTTGVIDQESYDIGLTARWAYQGELFGHKNEFVAGLSPTRGRTDAKNYRNVDATRGALLNDFDQKATNFETYLEDRLSLDEQWTLIAGLQYAKSKRDSQDQMITASGDQSVDKTYSQTSPKLGVLYQLQPQVQLFANASRSFEPPSFGELNSLVVSSLKAQKGTTFEIGSRGNSEFVDWDVAFYQARLQDELLQVGAAGSPFASQTINAGKTIHRGLEFGLTARLPYSLQWRSSLLINDFKLDNDPTFGSNRLPGIQRSLLRAELVYRGSDVLENFYIGPTIEWSPQRYNVDFAETLYADSYFLWGMKAGQKINQHWSWFIEGRNLANQKYAATTGVVADATRAFTSQAQFFPGDGRTAYLGVTWTY